MIEKKKEFYLGLGLIIGFAVVLIFFFLPVFEGRNALDYLDNLYNSISKGSAYYIPKVKEDSDKFKGNAVTVNLTMASEKQAEQTALLFTKAGAAVSVSGAAAAGERRPRQDPGERPGGCGCHVQERRQGRGRKVRI